MFRLLFKRPGRQAREALEAPEPVGPDLLKEGPLLARWYILLRLGQAIELAGRHGRPLSIVVARPVAFPEEAAGYEALAAGAEAARRVARSTDLVGWLEEGSILVIMPETTEHHLKSAVFRWGSELALRTKRKWRFATIGDAGRYKNADEVLEAAREPSTERKAA